MFYKSGMELQTIIAHVGSLFIYKKIMKKSDKHTAYLYINCNLFAIYKKSSECYYLYCSKNSTQERIETITLLQIIS
jgi:hypothetical protein